MNGLLICWIGETDLRAETDFEKIGVGPIAQACLATPYQEVALLTDYRQERSVPYVNWLKHQINSPVSLTTVTLSGPTDFEEIYQAASAHLSCKLQEYGGVIPLTFHVSPGTPAMAAVWIILAKTKFPAQLIESSKVHGVKTISFPFDISAEFIPDLLGKRDRELERRAAALPNEAPEFNDIICRSHEMQNIIYKAQRVALRSIPVLIEGESGTGKELLARAIHRASPRREKPFVAVNCGAIPPEIIESELFGHVKGSFTGASDARKGYFETANTGTLFLDEVGELPAMAQVKLLRVLQEREIVRLGASVPVKIDVRIIAATNRTLTDEIAGGRFREDLFYRLAVAVLKLPALRERTGDIGLLIDRLLETVNIENAVSEPGYKHKIISAGARNLMLQHPWPGNIRELLNTLHRATVWSAEGAISEEDIREALLPVAPSGHGADSILNRPIEQGVNLPELLSGIATGYLKKAMDKTNNNKTKAAELLALPSYQTLANWLKKYNIE